MIRALPRGFTFLSGYPAPLRATKVLMPAQVFADDSGYPGQSPVFVMGGLWGHAEQWMEFSDDWAAALAEPPAIQYFKMQEAATCKDQFANWSFAKRDAKLKRLIAVINQFSFRSVHVGIDNMIREEFFGDANRLNSHPYFQAFHNFVVLSCMDVVLMGEREPFELTFDEQLSLGPRTKAWYPVIRALAPPVFLALLPVEPRMESDTVFLPLQAADMVTWLARRDKSGEANPFEWVAIELTGVVRSPYSRMFDRAEYERILRLAQERSFVPSPQYFIELRKVLGMDAGESER